jgi:hypothetical protein
MKEEELGPLATLIAREVVALGPHVIGGGVLSTFDISAVAKCCEEKCPCNSKEDKKPCGCIDKCGCDGKTKFIDDVDWISRLAGLPQDEIRKVLEVVPILQKMRLPPPEPSV